MSDISDELGTNTFSYFWKTVGRTYFIYLIEGLIIVLLLFLVLYWLAVVNLEMFYQHGQCVQDCIRFNEMADGNAWCVC